MTRLAIVGSRAYPDLAAVRSFVCTRPSDTIIISGGARGVDATAAHEARRQGLTVIEHLPDYRAHGRRAPLIRNAAIVADCDALVAFWDGTSTGTMHAIRAAEGDGKAVLIFRAEPRTLDLEAGTEVRR